MSRRASWARLAVAAAVLLSALALGRSKFERVAACEARCKRDAGECTVLCKKMVHFHPEVCTKACDKEEQACSEECREPVKRATP